MDHNACLTGNPDQLQPLDGVRRIAVLRSFGLGDFIGGLPALEALRATYPASEIVLLGVPWQQAFLAGRPGPVDRVALLPAGLLSATGTEPATGDELERSLNGLRAQRFDLAVQLFGGGRQSNALIAALGARLSVGMRTPDAPPLDRWIPYLFYQHETLRALEVVALAGARPVDPEPRLAVTAADRAEAEAALPGDGAPLAVLHPGAGDARRRWPPERFAAVGDALAAAGARVAVIGTEQEAAIAGRTVAAMRAPAANLCGRLSTGGLAGLLARAAVLIGNDSGPRHLAAAVGAATVAVYWCGNLITFGPHTRRRQRPVLSWRLDCPVCGLDCTRGRCEHDASFVADVPVEFVLEPALELLHTEAPRAAQRIFASKYAEK